MGLGGSERSNASPSTPLSLRPPIARIAVWPATSKNRRFRHEGMPSARQNPAQTLALGEAVPTRHLGPNSDPTPLRNGDFNPPPPIFPPLRGTAPSWCFRGGITSLRRSCGGARPQAGAWVVGGSILRRCALPGDRERAWATVKPSNGLEAPVATETVAAAGASMTPSELVRATGRYGRATGATHDVGAWFRGRGRCIDVQNQ